MLKAKFRGTTFSSLLHEIRFFLIDHGYSVEAAVLTDTPSCPSPAQPVPKPEKQVTVHSPIGASSMKRWRNCPGSVKLSENQPSSAGIAAAEGTLAHEMAESLFAGRAVSNEKTTMLDHVQTYVEFIREETKDATYFGVEQGFALIRINPKLFGTCDVVAYWADQKLLRIYDLKYGKTTVDPEENDQLLYYALGALQTFEFHVEEIELVIYQPRKPVKGEIIRRWRFNTYPKMNDFASMLYTAAKATELPNAELHAGDWCFWCNARNICPVKRDEKMEKSLDYFADIVGE